MPRIIPQNRSGTVTVQDEGTSVDSQTTTINFTGAGVTATSGGAGIINVDISGGGAGADERVGVSSNDTTPDYLINKLTSARPTIITWTEVNDAGDEDLRLNVTDMVGDAGAGGTAGLVPAPAAGDAASNFFLHADGTWQATAGSGNVSNTGVPVNNQIAVWTDATTIEGDTSLTFDTTTDTLAIGASGALAFGAVTILSDAAGTTTLNNIDALDATTETTIETAIDTLNNLTSASSLATVGTITTGTWNGSVISPTYGGTGVNTSASTGVAQVSAGTWSVSTALADGTTATTQAPDDNSTNVATTAYVDAAVDTSDTLSEVLANGNTTGANDIVVSNGQAIQTAQVAGNTLLLQAYDTDLTGYVTFVTLTANNTPTMDLSTSVTVGGPGNNVAYTGGAFHDGFSDFVANEHIDHSGVTLTAGEGLTGGGDITANRSFALDFSDLSTTDTAVGATDLVSIHDGAQKKITFANFEGSLNHDNLTGFVSDEHIDHTGVTLTAGTGISGGGDISASRTFDLAVDTLAEKTGDLVGTDRLTGTSGTTNFSETINVIPLSIFNNDAGWTSNTGTVDTTGTPANNQIAIFTDADTIEGDANLTWDGTNFNIATARNFQIAGVTILADAAGTTTLSGIDALDATTETTIEAAIDTLSNLTSASSLATVGTITAGTWNGDTITVANGGTGATSFTSNAILTGDGTNPIVAEGNLLFDGSDLTLYEAVNDGNPSVSVGSGSAETFVVQSVYDVGAQTLDKVTFTTKAASASADKGLMEFYVDEALTMTLDDGGLNLANGKQFEINGTPVLTNNTLGSGVVTSSLTTVGTIGTGTWQADTVAVAYGGTGLSTFGGVNTVLYTTAADTLASDANFTWNGSALNITGNITVSGTVDGVDISARDHDAVTLNAAVTDILSLSTQEITAVDAGAADAIVGWLDGSNKITYLSSAQATATLDDMVGDSGAGGTAGLAPAPGAGDAASNKFLKADGTWQVPGGGGNVSNTGTPVNNQIAVWTDATTIEGDASLTFDTTSDTLAIGASGALAFGGVTILSDSAGTTTLNNIDALDTTTETTIENAIDTLGNLTSASSLATIGTITSGTWNGTIIGSAYGGTGQDFSSSTGAISVSSGTFSAGTLSVTNGGTGATSFTSNAILTGNSTSPIQAEGNLLFDGSDLTLYEAVNDGNPSVSVGSSATETFVVQSVYDGAAQTLDKVTFTTKAASVTADKGLMEFYVDEALIVTIDDDALNLASGKEFEINGTSVLSATTLGSGVTGSSLTSVGTIATGVWQATDIGVAYGGTGVSTFGGVNTVLYTTAADTLASDANFTWNGSALNVTGNITVSGTVDGVDISARDHDAVTLNAAVTDILSLSTQEITAVDAGAADAIVGWLDGSNKITYLSSAQATATLDDMVGDAGAGGTAGLAPAPAAGDTAAGKFLKADGTWAVPAGGGNVSNTGTPVDNQIAVWTGATTIEGTTALTFDGSDFSIFETVNDGNPTVSLGSSTAEALVIQSVYDGAAQTLDKVTFTTKAASATADKGLMEFYVDEALTVTLDDGGLNLASGKQFEINGTPVLTSTTLGSGVTSSSLTSVGTIGTGVWQGTVVANTYGGTGQNSSAWTGIVQVNSGVWSVDNDLPAGTTLNTNKIVIGEASGLDDEIVTYNGTTGDTLQGIGLKNFGPLATASEPTGNASGDLYYNTDMDLWMIYDSTRTKWLSQEVVELKFGGSGNVAANAYFSGVDGNAFTSTNGRNAEWNGTVVSIVYTRDDTDSATFEVTAGGVATGAEIASTALKGSSLTLNSNFNQNDVLGVRNKTGGNTVTDVMGTVRLRWRAT